MKRMVDHNSYEFHQDFGKISPENEYRNQLQTARMAVFKFGGPPEYAAKSYQVRVEDILSGVPIEQITRMDYAQNSVKG